jgi:O-antigen ligase
LAESSLGYNTFFVYPHVFSRLLFLYIIFFAYLFPTGKESHDVVFIAVLICSAFLVDLLLYRADILSLSSFLNTKRGFNVESTYLLLIPMLFFFNKYLEKNTFIYLFFFYALLAIIIFLQHRTVWIAAGISLVANFLLLKKASFKRHSQSYSFLIVLPLIAAFLLFTFLFSTNPDFIDKLLERANDIVNYKTEGTGSWRYQQFMAYWPYIKDNFFFGMHFKGFELPMQFYQPDAGIPVFNDGTGHHFHSFYVDKLFYLGLVGLILFIAPFFYLIHRIIKSKNLSPARIALTAFVISGLTYGISYWWPICFYGVFGFVLAMYDKRYEKEKEPEDKSLPSIDIPVLYKKEYI